MSKLTDQIDKFGQTDEKEAAKVIKKLQEEREKEEDKRESQLLDNLDFTKASIFDYRQRIFKEANYLIKEQKPPKGYLFAFELTQQGIVLWIKDPKGKYHANGMKISQNPIYDAQGLHKLIDKGFMYVDKLNG